MDFRDKLVTEKYFMMIPVPLMEYVAKLDLTMAQALVFFAHWQEGMNRKTWKSKIAISVICKRFGFSKATVLRAYKSLAELGMVRREVTPIGSTDIPEVEVLVPEAAQAEMLISYPDRKKGSCTTDAPKSAESCHAAGAREPLEVAPAVEPPAQTLESQECIDDPFDPRLACVELLRISGGSPGQDEALKAQRASAEKAYVETVWKGSIFSRIATPGVGRRKVFRGMAEKVRNAVASLVPTEQALDVSNQVLWCMEEGHLNERNAGHALNFAMWFLRRGIWGKPAGMPEGWSWRPTQGGWAA